MVREGSTLAVLALASALLASFIVPLGSGAVAAKSDKLVIDAVAAPAGLSMAAQPEIGSSVVEGFASLSAGMAAAIILPRRDASTTRIEKAVPVLRDGRRGRVPVGCERVISGLVRSAAASEIASCVT